MSNDKTPDIEALSDLCTPWCLHVAATLRVAEKIDGGVTRIEALAEACGADRSSLQRVLQHLAARGVFSEVRPGEFALTDAARTLTEESVRLGLDLDGIGGRMAGAWASLLTAVRTGAPAYDTVFGRPFWEDLAAHPSIAASFDALMGPAGHGPPDPEVLVRGDWDDVHGVVDVGGGTGTLLAAILRAHPGVTGTLVDLPSTVAQSAAVFRDAGVAGRVTARGQSFFDPLPAGADLYILKNVLADWPDRDASRLLRSCRDALPPQGRITVVGGVADEGQASPAPEVLMLVLVGGRQRTMAEFRELAGGSGLKISATGRQASKRVVVELRAES